MKLTILNNSSVNESLSNFKSIFDTTMEMVVFYGEDKKIIDINEAGIKMFGFLTKKEVIGRSIIDFISKKSLPIILEALQNEVAQPYETTLLKADGSPLYTINSGRYIILDGKRIRMKTAIDLTQIKQKEKQLFAQSHLAQMGELISMIAHQWRQPLGAISTSAVNLRLKLELESFDLDTKESQEECSNYFIKRLENIENYVENLTHTIDDFRNFYKQNKESVRTTFKNVTEKSLNIVKASILSEKIELICTYNSEEKIEMHDSEMMQVILNILKNSQDNFKEKNIKKPKIIVETKDKSLSIYDNGGGISEDILAKIFDPYFSTKEGESGIGLGLYMSKIIVQNHHFGKLKAINTKDGVCFTIDLNGG